MDGDGGEESPSPSLALTLTTSSRERSSMGSALGHFFPDHHCLVQGFSALALLTPWTRQCCAVGGCHGLCRLFSSISGLYPLEARVAFPPTHTHPQLWHPKISPDLVKWSLKGQNAPQLRTTSLDGGTIILFFPSSCQDYEFSWPWQVTA